ncbi:MAG: M16 family metallopeptidase, partial [Longimicrobiales bacterium]
GVDRTRPPALDAIEPVRLPRIERHRLSNGLDVLVCSRPGLPVVELQLVLRSGAAADPAGGEGTAALVAELVDEGTAIRSALELADAFERLGTRLAIDAGWDGTTLALHLLRPRLEAALDLFGEVVTDAVFPDGEVRRKRDEVIAALVREEDEPAALASKAFGAAVYGPAHRYGVPLQGASWRQQTRT